MTISTAQVDIDASATVGVFESLSVTPGHYLVILQSRQSGSGAVLFLAQDAEGDSLGPAIATEGISASGASLPAATTQFLTDGDEVYVSNQGGSAAQLAVALIPQPVLESATFTFS